MMVRKINKTLIFLSTHILVDPPHNRFVFS
jgi:hypothetical protein